MEVKQELLHAHSKVGVQRAEGDLRVRLIDESDNTEDLRKGNSFWQHLLGTFKTNGLNGCEAALF